MGLVISLVIPRHRKPRKAMPHGHSCQIYILPCVRYERWEQKSGKAAAPGKKSRKRRARAR